MLRGARLALAVGAALAPTAAATSASAEVQAIGLDGCSGSCDSNPEEDPTVARDGTDLKVTMSLCGEDLSVRSNDSGRQAVVFDLKSAPAILFGGPPFPLSLSVLRTFGAQHIVTPYGDFEYVIELPRPGGGRPGTTAISFFTAAPSLTSGLTLSEILSKANAYFLASPFQRP